MNRMTEDFIIVELTDEQLEQLSQQAFMETAANLWQQKENEDLAYEGEY